MFLLVNSLQFLHFGIPDDPTWGREPKVEKKPTSVSQLSNDLQSNKELWYHKYFILAIEPAVILSVEWHTTTHYRNEPQSLSALRWSRWKWLILESFPACLMPQCASHASFCVRPRWL